MDWGRHRDGEMAKVEMTCLPMLSLSLMHFYVYEAMCLNLTSAMGTCSDA